MIALCFVEGEGSAAPVPVTIAVLVVSAKVGVGLNSLVFKEVDFVAVLMADRKQVGGRPESAADVALGADADIAVLEGETGSGFSLNAPRLNHARCQGIRLLIVAYPWFILTRESEDSVGNGGVIRTEDSVTGNRRVSKGLAIGPHACVQRVKLIGESRRPRSRKRRGSDRQELSALQNIESPRSSSTQEHAASVCSRAKQRDDRIGES